MENLPSIIKTIAGFPKDQLEKNGVPFNIYEYFLKNAKEYKPKKTEKRGVPQHCYHNAKQMMMKKKAKYIEGYVLVHGVPLSHAWNELKGEMVDCTIEHPGNEIYAHYGMEIPKEAVLMAMNHKRWIIADGVIGTIALMDDFDLIKIKKIFKQ